MKTISPDRSYIDYTTGNEGIRVWKDRFQWINKGPQGEWVPVDDQGTIPANEKDLRWTPFVPLRPGQGDPYASRIGSLIRRYSQDEDDSELEQVLLGTKTFEEAVSE
jgi:hypothetical protein